NQAATGITLQVSSNGLSGATTSAISVTAASASQLAVTTEPPAGVTAGSGFGLTIKAEDHFGNVDTNYSGGVTLTLVLASNTTGTTLDGVTTVTASGGVATFSDLTLNKAASGITLQASGGGLNRTTTSPITVTAAPASQLVITAQPPASVTAGAGFDLV